MSNTAPAGFFSGSDGMDASSKLPWFPANFSGRVRIDVVKGIVVRAGHRAYVVEVTVLESNLTTPSADEKLFVPVGSRRSWFQSLKETGTAYPACIGFLYAALGVSPSRDQAKIDKDIKPKQDEYLNYSISDANPLAKTEVMLQTSNKKLKVKGTDFTLHAWSAVAVVPSATATATA